MSTGKTTSGGLTQTIQDIVNDLEKLKERMAQAEKEIRIMKRKSKWV